jgi:hypothetical protein
MKKLTIQYDIYRMHLQLSNEWKSSWDLINPLLPERILENFLLLAEQVSICSVFVAFVLKIHVERLSEVDFESSVVIT